MSEPSHADPYNEHVIHDAEALRIGIGTTVLLADGLVAERVDGLVGAGSAARLLLSGEGERWIAVGDEK